MTKSIALCVMIAGLSLSTSAGAGASPASLNSDLDKQLEHFDPKALAAARHYFEQPEVRAGAVAMNKFVTQAMKEIFLKEYPDASPQQVQKVLKIVAGVNDDNFKLYLKISMLAQLQTFSTAEIVALDRFYSSPEGRAIMLKSPQSAEHLTALLKTVAPELIDQSKARIREIGREKKQ
ncbi:MAG: hypothetical protein ACLP8A_05365 [Methylovirgula sp.]